MLSIEQITSRLKALDQQEANKLEEFLQLLEASGFSWLIVDGKKKRWSASVSQNLRSAAVEKASSLRSQLQAQPFFFEIDKDFWIWREADSENSSSNLGLTAREKEVQDWRDAGKSVDETAMILGISSRTVAKHRQNLKKKENPNS